MNRIFHISLAWLLLAGGISGAAYADPVTINITGNVIAAPCVVDGTSSINVDLGDIPASDLAAVDAATPWKAFSMSVKNCPAGTTKVTASFSGTPAPDAPIHRYINTGTATGISIALARDTNVNLGNGVTWAVDVDSSRSATWPMRTRIVASNGKATPGTVKAVVVATLTYQ
ncbi:fimbrial protein [Serratia sp. AKBS12]|uniref:fimbrial protein n=1 Tax=Serratia sp. AKBS12 TaxID=2974597 RepID=UPI0021663B37|nr:fimbrial protein [Serratia sp. AKBS12]MCS3406717.1 type 1 fimbrial protein [Serratia sp. AKBS12]